MGDSPVHDALKKIVSDCEAAGIPYAIAGALALGIHGYTPATVDVDLLTTPEGLRAFKERYLGPGYADKFAGSKAVRDTVNGVTIDFLLTGEFPGDGRPKPVAFPDPADASVGGPRGRVLRLERLLELKLASGMSATHRLKDLGDVVETVKALDLPASFAEQVHPSVRDKFRELWAAAQEGKKDDY